MRAAAILAALLFTSGAEAQTGSVTSDVSLVDPPAPPGSPPTIRPGTVTRLSAGDNALRQIAVLGGSRIEFEVRGTGPVGALLYDPDGNRISAQDGSNTVRLNLMAPRDGIYYLAPIGVAGGTLEVSLAIVPPPRPADPTWKASVTELPLKKTGSEMHSRSSLTKLFQVILCRRQ